MSGKPRAVSKEEAEARPGVVQTQHTGDCWRKVVVDVKVTSTDDMSKSFMEKDEKDCEWTTSETLGEKVVVAMVPQIISHDRAIHRVTVGRWKSSLPTFGLTG